MRIEYTLAQVQKDRLKANDPGSLDRMRLLYHYTQGSVEVSCGNGAENLVLRGIPVLDFAWSLLHILQTLQANNEAEFVFTENHDTIRFRYSGDVIITTSYSEWVCQCSYDDLKTVVLEFSQTLLNDLCNSVPEFEANSLVGEARKKITDYRADSYRR